MTKEEIIQVLSNIEGLGWMKECREEYSEDAVRSLYQRVMDFRKKWLLRDCRGFCVETWGIEMFRAHDGRRLYRVESEEINPFTVVEGGIFLEEFSEDDNCWVRRYLFDKKIYHVRVEFIPPQIYQIQLMGYEVYADTEQPRMVTIHFDICSSKPMSPIVRIPTVHYAK